jgi:hypothetical protein
LLPTIGLNLVIRGSAAEAVDGISATFFKLFKQPTPAVGCGSVVAIMAPVSFAIKVKSNSDETS